MDTITSLVGVLETELEGGEPTTSLSSLNALYALYALQNRAEAAEAEVERLRQELATVAADVKLMLRTPHNHDWLASGDCPRCAIEQRLIANTTPARQRSSGGAVDDD
jgi:hypothetical protein